MKLYKIIIGFLIGICIFLSYNTYMHINQISNLKKELIDKELHEIKRAKKLVDSVQQLQLDVIKKITKSEQNIKILKKDLNNIKIDSMSLDEVKKSLGL